MSEKNGMQLKLALEVLEQEKNIPKEAMLSAIEKALYNAYVSHFKSENCKVVIDPETCDYQVFSLREVVSGEVFDPEMEISLEDAIKIDKDVKVGDEVPIEIKSKDFGRVATTNAKNQILQRLREEEKNAILGEFLEKEHKVVTGVVQRFTGKNIHVNLGNSDSVLPEGEQVARERFKIGEHVKVYVTEVIEGKKGPRILVSRMRPELVKGLFELEVAEIEQGLIEIKAVSREAGSRSKIAVYSSEPEIDAVGSCVGMNGNRVSAIVDELKGEKIDIVEWDENPAYFIENALSPSKIIAVVADEEEKEALVIVPDYQLSLAIGKDGQNVRLAAKLTGYKIDIKSETQAKESGDLPSDYESEYFDESELTNIDLDLERDELDLEDEIKEMEEAVESVEEENADDQEDALDILSEMEEASSENVEEEVTDSSEEVEDDE